MHSTKQKPGPSWVKWAIRKERSDAAARQNETQRQFDYVASAPAHEQLLTSKRAALQAAMQEQLDLAAACCRCVAVQVAAGCRCAAVHEQQQQQAAVHVL
ncbi:hypothetical protein QJQ45_016489 [Haematococcus lacustris]|nr:hypothetical protein QJQ45_016489 [Haematococcus lacustris]